MDTRTLISGGLAAIALIGSIILSAINKDMATVTALMGVATTFGGYVVGLYSEPYGSA